MPQRRVGGVLAALCVAAGTSGVLAIGLLAPSNHGVGSSKSGSYSSGSGRAGWPIAAAFSASSAVGWAPLDPNTSTFTGPPSSAGAGAGTGNAASAAPPPPSAPAPPPAPAPASVPPTANVVSNSSLPPAGEATAYGCNAALAYLAAYAAPGFWLVCPGVARGHQAMTVCQSSTSPCSYMRIIVIADPCPNAYMNEASNSWALMGESDAPLDPYGPCG